MHSCRFKRGAIIFLIAVHPQDSWLHWLPDKWIWLVYQLIHALFSLVKLIVQVRPEQLSGHQELPIAPDVQSVRESEWWNTINLLVSPLNNTKKIVYFYPFIFLEHIKSPHLVLINNLGTYMTLFMVVFSRFFLSTFLVISCSIILEFYYAQWFYLHLIFGWFLSFTRHFCEIRKFLCIVTKIR